MLQFFIYWVWPNPGGWHYHDHNVEAYIALNLALIVLSFVIRYWRQKQKNPQTRILSSSWSSVAFWFAIVGLFLIVCRVEQIQFLSMRLLWAFWVLALILFVIFQALQFRRRHYTVVGRPQTVSHLDKYLPKKGR